MRFTLLLIFVGFLFSPSYAQEKIDTSTTYKLRAVAELGYLAVLQHQIQFGQNGTYINYVQEGGQSNLYPVSRYSIEFDIGKKNTIILLYQPLTIETTDLPEKDLVIDGLTFPAGEGVKFLYNFPFYRISYLREFYSERKDFDFSFGLSMQIRNANITFESTDGSRFRNNQDLGIVPILKFRTTKYFGDRLYGQIEADGFYAPISYLNGSTNEVVGAILDASVRAGYKIADSADAFVNLRYLGGGAVGTSDEPDFPGDGYVKNWLNFLTVSTGAVYKF